MDCSTVSFLEQLPDFRCPGTTQQSKKQLDQVPACPEFILSPRRTWRRDAIRLKHYAYSTEKTCGYWARHFVLYHSKRHLLEMGGKDISEFRT